MNINRWFLYIISYIMILAASSNDGFSSYHLGVPFAIFLLIDLIFQFYKKSYVVIVHSVFLVFSGYLLLADRATNELLYPLVNQTISVDEDSNITHSEFFQNELDFYYGEPYEGKVYHLEKGSKFVIRNQTLTGNPDFGTSYVFIIENIGNKNLFEKFLHNANKYQPRYRDMSPVYRELSREKIYISGYDLGKFSPIDSFGSFNRFNVLGIVLIWIIYLPVFIAFIISLVIYYRKFSLK